MTLVNMRILTWRRTEVKELTSRENKRGKITAPSSTLDEGENEDEIEP